MILELVIAQVAQMMVLNASFPIRLMNQKMYCSITSCVGTREKLLSPSLNGKLSTVRESLSSVGQDSRSTELLRAEWRVPERKGSFCVGDDVMSSCCWDLAVLEGTKAGVVPEMGLDGFMAVGLRAWVSTYVAITH